MRVKGRWKVVFMVSALLLLGMGRLSALDKEDLILGEMVLLLERPDLLLQGFEAGLDSPEDDRAALSRTLEDARWIISGMIYGFRIRWIPSWKDKAVVDQWEMEPLALIPRGDVALTVPNIVKEGNLVYYAIRYTLSSSQRSRRTGWMSQALDSAAGRALIGMDPDVRRMSLEEATKQAIRGWLRSREYNRPREVRGTVAFDQFPRTNYGRGGMVSDVVLRMNLDPPRHYIAD
ncbi:MAG: hypothetical protein MI717_06030 [Spirochaetales bacterium]|nr:hypothetical protein [Spirochaetales bacterium]